jgi:anaerobic magnesium-protoporphyrin IX monomethyl ester cyclase
MKDFSIHSETVRKFDEELLNMIQKGLNEFEDNVFNQLALREFEIQYNNVDYFRNLCQTKGVTPENIKHWEEIPAVSSAVFKMGPITTFPLYETELALTTSGTSDPLSPSKIYRDKRCVEMYYLANVVMTKNFLFPDVDRMRILLMVPSPKLAPTMGMAVGLEQMRQNFGTENSMYLITPNGMEWELLFNALHEAEESGKPVAIVGATSGFVYFYNFCREQGLSFKLPTGSRICDGGGYLGTFGDCTREEYYKLCFETLAIPEHYCVNTLGSGESTTNYFDNVLHNYHLGIKDIPRYKVCPPWARTFVVDPETGKRLPKGKMGLLRHYDLVNRANVMVIQSNNLGYETEGGFEIIGRADAVGKASNTVLNTMIEGHVCSTIADNMLIPKKGECSTVAESMLTGAQSVCSTTADEMLKKSPHGKMFSGISQDRLEKLKQMCPFLRLQGLFK